MTHAPRRAQNLNILDLPVGPIPGPRNCPGPLQDDTTGPLSCDPLRASTVLVHPAELGLPTDVPLLGRQTEPPDCFLIVLPHPTTVAVPAAEVVVGELSPWC